jgi:tetratricopeptide (TPR) repeat protein
LAPLFHSQVTVKDDGSGITHKLLKPSLPGLNLLKKAVQEEEPKKNKFEALALCYANRSAALRRLCQYEDCLRDIARAARFGYPKENMYKLWERKGKCYFGLKRYELAAKCVRQSLNALKESGLSDLAKASKNNELQGLLKEWRNAQELATMGSSGGSAASSPTGEPAQLMGATGPLVLIADSAKAAASGPAAAASAPPPPPPAANPAAIRKTSEPVLSSIPEPKPERRSVRKKAVPNPSNMLAVNNNGDNVNELRKTESRISISQLSMGSGVVRSEVPDLSYGINPRMPSASVGIDLRFAPERGRFFVATQDLVPGK